MGRCYKLVVGLFLGFFLMTAIQVNAGGGWTQKKGEGFYKLSEWWLVYDKHFTDQGQFDPNIRTGVFNTFLYGEYGVTDRFTAVVNANLMGRNSTANVFSKTTNELLIQAESVLAVGDIDLVGKWAIPLSKKVQTAVSVGLGLPTGATNGGTQGNLQTGDGEFNQWLQLDLGTGFSLFSGVSSFANVFLAINNRTQGFSDEFRYGIETGLCLAKNRLWLIYRMSGVESLYNGSSVLENETTGIFANNTEYLSYGFEFNYRIKNGWGVSAGFASAFQGKIIAAAPSYSVGVFLDTQFLKKKV
ncbi:MAG: hypothetical protein ACI9YL_001464 [Luteibaculaceae bacterium]|jgi:hypothetical protein